MEKVFLGSRDYNESEEDHLIRELRWKDDHACSICGNFYCDGNCEERQND